jgi:competence protein ComEA
VYAISRQGRVQDALLAAGGALPKADLDGINLAAFVEDGARIWVPYKVEAAGTPAREVIPQVMQSTPGLPENPPNSGLIDLNSASQSELENLPGIGPVLAGRIVAYRQANGPFLKAEDLLGVEGIGPSILEKIDGLVTVGGAVGSPP